MAIDWLAAASFVKDLIKDYWIESKQSKAERLAKLQRIKTMMDGYTSEMRGHWDSLSNGTFTTLRLPGDLNTHHREFHEMIGNIPFWKFKKGMDWKTKLTEFHEEYAKLKTVQPSLQSYKIKHDFALEKADRLIGKLVSELTN